MTPVYDLPVPGTLAMSDAGLWSRCAGSFALGKTYPSTGDSEARREGTAGHFWALEAVKGTYWPEGHIAPNGVPIDADMIEHGCELIGVLPDGVEWNIEQPISAPGLIHPDCDGRPDLYSVDFTRHKITVFEYKYGHREVLAEGNPVLLAYVAGIVERCELTRADVKGWEISLNVFQPRCFRPGGPLKTWRLLGHEAWTLIEQLQEAAHIAKVHNAPTRTGDQCADCSAAVYCPTLLRVGNVLLDQSGDSIPAELSPAAMGLMLRHVRGAIKRLEALETGLSATVEALLRQGQSIPFWGMGPGGQGREKWTASVAEVEFLAQAYDVELIKKVPITPAQARKLGVSTEGFSERPPAGTTLVPVDANSARKAFS